MIPQVKIQQFLQTALEVRDAQLGTGEQPSVESAAVVGRLHWPESDLVYFHNNTLDIVKYLEATGMVTVVRTTPSPGRPDALNYEFLVTDYALAAARR